MKLHHDVSLSFNRREHYLFTCLSCHRVMDAPVTTPCAHNFCISCLSYQSSNSEARVLRSRNNSMKCPSCTTDIFDFLHKPQVNGLI
uniref:Putative zinc finger, RING/FYVE/PHD-type n=1 Tax=Helianthus annuus TaxID=4232 RepID=A0A251VHX0_HELAN